MRSKPGSDRASLFLGVQFPSTAVPLICCRRVGPIQAVAKILGNFGSGYPMPPTSTG
ncbi:hypothetical protein RHECNPAF_3500031 [Rhizobium etli CNPAF512]|nr:hypothetical protein RHECNPAF_3500031 [Rhizobium etli CNPAF512]